MGLSEEQSTTEVVTEALTIGALFLLCVWLVCSLVLLSREGEERDLPKDAGSVSCELAPVQVDVSRGSYLVCFFFPEE